MRYLKALVLAGLLCGAGLAAAQGGPTLTHIHGLAYSPDGKRLMVPSHHGLAVYESGKWSKAPGPQHDYMGFVATGKHLYSSGHPAPGSGLVNPFGLIRSRDGGKTWDRLTLEGETDFHVLSASWNTNVICVWNPAPSSRIREPGLHCTENEGATWRKARASGMEGDPIAVAVHPDNPSLMALGTSEGVYESADVGQSFEKIGGPGVGTSVFYDLDGKHLWIAAHDGKEAHLGRARLRGGPVTQVTLPRLPKDAVSYIAQNPARRSEYAIATFERSIYLSQDGGRSWKQIASAGRTR